MDDDSLLEFGRHLLNLDADIAELKASVNALKIVLASQLTPENPLESLEQIEHFEKKLLKNDPSRQERKKALDTLDAIQKWIERGKPPLDT